MNSVLIVAHNEGENIARCLESLTRQSRTPDEIVLIAHNCTDDTAAVARRFPVRVVEYTGPVGAIHARIRGFEEVQGDIVACIDADGAANKRWFETLIEKLEDPSVSIVGSVIFIDGTLTRRIGSVRTYFMHYPLFRIFGIPKFLDVWGAGFAIRVKDYEAVGGLRSFFPIHEELGFPDTYWPDDFYLTAALAKKGKVRIALSSVVRVRGKETSELDAIERSLMQQRGGRILARRLGV